jgi:5-oxoprolinase (ATP-hydrolysing) subunit A
MKCIDINCDMGESPERLADGNQEALMRYVTSANIACGSHAGDRQMMQTTIEQARRWKVAVGAHPGYEDRADFGRRELQLSSQEITASVHKQILTLAEIAEECGAQIDHVKPHGALYHQAVHDREIARAIATGVCCWKNDVVMVGLAGSLMLDEFRAAGLDVAAEAFADRRYEADGSLRSRKFENALLRNPTEAAAQALRIVEQGSVVATGDRVVPLQAQTICIHGDTPGALQIAEAVSRTLRSAGITLKSLRGMEKSAQP